MIDPKDAPEGYSAVEPEVFHMGLYTCQGCDFYRVFRTCHIKECRQLFRKDCKDVIFKKNKP